MLTSIPKFHSENEADQREMRENSVENEKILTSIPKRHCFNAQYQVTRRQSPLNIHMYL